MTDEEKIKQVTAKLAGELFYMDQPVWLDNGPFGLYPGFYRGRCLTGGALFEFDTSGNRMGVSYRTLCARET